MANDLLPMPEKIPDFYILGGPKCGTTSLFEWLRQHPDAYMPAKEPSFLSHDVYDARGVAGAFSTWDLYLARMLPPEAVGKTTGEATPRTLYSDLAFEALSQHPDQPKVIAIMRNPIDLVFSLHAQMIRQGVEAETDFARAWARAVAKGNNPEAWRSREGRMDRRLDYPMFGRLGARAEALLKHFPEDQRRIFVLERDLHVNAAGVVTEVLDFLGLPPHEIDVSPRNARVELRAPGLNRALVKLRGRLQAVKARLGFDVTPRAELRRGTGLLRLITRLNTAPRTEHRKLDPEMRAELAAFFADEVARVRKALDAPIREWRDWPQ